MKKNKTPAQPLLHSKLNPPISSRVLVSRTRLIEQLQSAGHAKLVLLRVPAGFGKTTLIVQWLAHLKNEGVYTAWLTLDEADNDPGRFFTYLIAALRSSTPEFDLQNESDLMEAGHAPAGALLYILDRMTALKKPLTLVLDDFGAIKSPELLNVVQQLLNHLPPGIRLVIAIRQVPELGLERLRAQGEIFEIEQEDLQFTLEETGEFVRKTQGLDLDDNDIEYLHNFTEGWVAGLQLSTLSTLWRKNRDEETQVRSWKFGKIYDYLAEEVLVRQPEEVQSFLLQTSILGRLSGALCDRLTGRSDSYKMLDYLERSNIFLMPLDAERMWYRYHSLFAKFLRNRLERLTPEKCVALHRAACDWFSESGEIQEAAEHARLAGDVEYAARQMDVCIFDLVRSGLTATIVDWGEWLPDSELDRHPAIQIAYAYACVVRHQSEKALETLDRLESSLKKAKIKNHLAYDVRNIRALAFFSQDNVRECERVTLEALKECNNLKAGRTIRFLPTLFHVAGVLKLTTGKFEETSSFIWNSARIIGSSTGVMMLFNKFLEQCLVLIQGSLGETLALTESALAEAQNSPSRFSGGGTAVSVLQAEVLYEKNELARAEKLLGAYYPMLSSTLPDIMIIGFRTLARIRAAYGDTTGAGRYLAQLERLGAERGLPRVSATARQERLRVAIQRGDIAHALHIHKQHNDQYVWSSFEGRCMIGNDPETPEITRLRLMIGQGQARKALEELKDCLKKAESAGFFRQGLLIRILTVKALESVDEKRQALRVMRDALVLAQKEDFIRIFVDEGNPVPKMVREIQKTVSSERLRGKESISLKYLDKIMHAIGEVSLHPTHVEPDSDLPPPEPLTGREIDILSKMALGSTNEDLADQLCLSIHTVRFHLRNIYWKLGAHNRTQAVALARRFGLIS